MKKLFRKEQLIVNYILISSYIIYYIIIGIVFGFDNLISEVSILGLVIRFFVYTLFIPLVLVLFVMVEGALPSVWDKKTLIVLLSILGVLSILAFLFFFILGLIQNDILIMDRTLFFAVYPVSVWYIIKWYKFNFKNFTIAF